MRFFGAIVAVTASGLVLGAGCGLDLVGVPLDIADGAIPDGGPSPSSPPPSSTPPSSDAATDADWPDAPPPTCSCAITPPAGWTLVAYAPDRASACPGTNFASRDLLTNAAAPPTACSCATCSVTAAANCNSGTLSTKNDNNTGSGVCNNAGTSHPVNNGACTALTGTFVHFGQSVPPTAVGGTCAAAGVGDSNAATSDAVRACAPTGATCACDPSLPPAFHTCMRADGDVACPAAAPTKHLVGAAITVTCAACSCALATTCTGTLGFYSDGACATLVAQDPSDKCNDNGGGSYASYKWMAGTSQATCQTKVQAGAPTTAYATPTTICCP